jgi:imidazolonepropionase-like amidohydrolase
MRLELQALKHVYPWLSWELLLRMATVNGAKALGLAGQVGELTVGAWADVVVWGLPEETPHQLEALLATGLNTTAPPQAVFVAGCPV